MSQSFLRPVDERKDFVRTYGETKPVLDLLLELLGYLNPDLQIFQSATQSTAASTTGTFALDPPDAENEMEIWGAALIMNNNIDGADVIKIYFSDLVAAFNFNLAAATVSQLGGTLTVLAWPAAIEDNAALFVIQLNKNLILKKSASSAPYKRLNFSIATTATVGSRSWTAQALYQSRPRLNQ